MNTKTKRVLSLYPTERAYLIVGYHIPSLNSAVERWAHIMANGIRYNEDTLTRPEWCALVEAHEGTLFEATDNAPQERLASKLEDPACAYLEEKWTVNIGRLTATIRDMSPLEAWAAILVVQMFWRERKYIDLGSMAFWELETIMHLNLGRMMRREAKFSDTKESRRLYENRKKSG